MPGGWALLSLLLAWVSTSNSQTTGLVLTINSIRRAFPAGPFLIPFNGKSILASTDFIVRCTLSNTESTKYFSAITFTASAGAAGVVTANRNSSDLDDKLISAETWVYDVQVRALSGSQTLTLTATAATCGGWSVQQNRATGATCGANVQKVASNGFVYSGVAPALSANLEMLDPAYSPVIGVPLLLQGASMTWLVTVDSAGPNFPPSGVTATAAVDCAGAATLVAGGPGFPQQFRAVGTVPDAAAACVATVTGAYVDDLGTKALLTGIRATKSEGYHVAKPGVHATVRWLDLPATARNDVLLGSPMHWQALVSSASSNVPDGRLWATVATVDCDTGSAASVGQSQALGTGFWAVEETSTAHANGGHCSVTVTGNFTDDFGNLWTGSSVGSVSNAYIAITPALTADLNVDTSKALPLTLLSGTVMTWQVVVGPGAGSNAPAGSLSAKVHLDCADGALTWTDGGSGALIFASIVPEVAGPCTAHVSGLYTDSLGTTWATAFANNFGVANNVVIVTQTGAYMVAAPMLVATLTSPLGAALSVGADVVWGCDVTNKGNVALPNPVVTLTGGLTSALTAAGTDPLAPLAVCSGTTVALQGGQQAGCAANVTYVDDLGYSVVVTSSPSNIGGYTTTLIGGGMTPDISAPPCTAILVGDGGKGMGCLSWTSASGNHQAAFSMKPAFKNWRIDQVQLWVTTDLRDTGVGSGKAAYKYPGVPKPTFVVTLDCGVTAVKLAAHMVVTDPSTGLQSSLWTVYSTKGSTAHAIIIDIADLCVRDAVSTHDSDAPPSDDNSAVVIAGIIGAVAAVLAIAVGVSYYVVRVRKSQAINDLMLALSPRMAGYGQGKDEEVFPTAQEIVTGDPEEPNSASSSSSADARAYLTSSQPTNQSALPVTETMYGIPV